MNELILPISLALNIFFGLAIWAYEWHLRGAMKRIEELEMGENK